jgi:hypothetical protein
MSWTTPEPSQQQRVPAVAAGAPARGIAAAAAAAAAAVPPPSRVTAAISGSGGGAQQQQTTPSFSSAFSARQQQTPTHVDLSRSSGTDHDIELSVKQLQESLDKELHTEQQSQATEQALKDEILTSLREQLDVIEDDEWMFKNRPVI